MYITHKHNKTVETLFRLRGDVAAINQVAAAAADVAMVMSDGSGCVTGRVVRWCGPATLSADSCSASAILTTGHQFAAVMPFIHRHHGTVRPLWRFSVHKQTVFRLTFPSVLYFSFDKSTQPIFISL